MSGRHNFGSHLEFELSVISPGPCYNPDEVAMKYMSTDSATTFGPAPWLISEEEKQRDEMRKAYTKAAKSTKVGARSALYGGADSINYTGSDTKAMKTKIWKNIKGGASTNPNAPRFRKLEYY
jgi:hypothetical protein